jgi:hypothetical protein
MSNPLRTPEDYELFLSSEMSFTEPNLPALIREIEGLIKGIEIQRTTA